ncbi:MAG: autotransporter-associated beta strand repeat-containing protein, partial [Chthoniobacter sp.]|uniref:beta strand repeat-containing protein n=1 Tax=Chthoniobacter sp. TaxID=2510640 RepID=UPI0032A42659
MKLTNRPLLLLFGCCRNSRKIFFVCSRSILLAGIMVLIAWRFSQAASLTWDGGDATHNGTFGGTGTWDLNTTANWDNGAADVVWTDNSATGVDTAIFSGTAGTVTLNTNLSALGLQFTTTGYTISGTGVLTLGSGGISAGALTIGTTTIGNALSLVGGQSWTVGAGGTLAASGTITRNVGSTVDFSSAGTFNGAGLVGATSATTANGWATVGGTNWAINDGTNITALTNYASATATTSTAGGTTVANYTGKDVDVTNSPGALAGVVTINSLRFNTTAANTFTFATGVNTITSGGILVTSAVGNNLSTITGGTLQGAAGKDLVVIQNNTSNGLTIGSIIQNNTTATGLTKTGAGTLTLSGVNTYTGGTTINAGTLQITQTTSAAATGTFNLGGGTFQINQAGSNFGYSSTINLTADSTFSSIGAGAINWTGTLNGNSHVLNANSGATRVYLNGTFNNVTQINITAGAVGLDLASTGHESTPVVVSSGASLFVANATNTLASNITLNGGTGFGGTGALALESGANLTPVLSGTLTLNSGNSSIGNAGTANAGNNISITGKVTGTGSLTKISINRLTLSNATNDYNGSTTITGGVLQANDGVGLPTGSFLSLDGGVLQSNNSSASFTRSLGTSGGGNFQFTANGGGFSANGGQLTVNIGGATAGQTWGSTVGTNLVGTLQFGSVSANAKTLFQNAIDLNGGTRTINVTAGTGGDSAEISGNITNSTGTGALTFGVAGTGTLVLSGTNTFNGALTLTSGVLSVGATANLGGASADNNVTFNGGTLQVTGISMTSFGSHTLTYNASKTVGFDINNAANNFNAGATAFVSTDTLLKTGAGTLTLGAASNTIKILQLNQGTLDIGANNLTISNTGGTTINDASTSGTTTINATGGGKIVLSQNSTTDGPDIGAANGATLIINANITGTSSFESWTGTNNGTGVTVLNGTNDYTSDTLIHGGVLSVSSVGNQGSTTSNLGKGTTIHFGTSTVSSGVLLYTGAGETSNRVIDLQGTTAGGTIDASGSGLLKFTSNLTTTGNGAKTLTLQGSDSGEFAGNLINSSSATSITKAGAGTWTLSGANTYTGATTLSGGTLIAAANAGNTPVSTSSALSASTTVTLGVGTTLELLGNTTNTIFAPTSVVESGNGTFNFIAGNNGSGTGNTLILANMGQFGPASTAPTFNFSSLNGYNWQLGSGASGTGALNVFNSTAINSNTAGSTLSMPGGITINFAAAYTLTYGGAGNISSGTLVQNGAFASQWAYNGTGKLTLAAGYTFTGTSTIASGGTVQLGNGATAVTMSGGITNNGTLIYDPNAAFTSTAITGTGAVTIIGGQTVKKTTSLSTGLLTLGDSSTTGTLDLNGTAQTVGGLTNGSFTPASDSIVNTGVAAALTIDTTNGSQSFGGVISPATANLISLVKTGNNTQTFNGTTASTFTGGITVNGGTLALNEANVAGTNNLVSSSNALILGGGTLSVSGGTQTLASLATTANTTSFLTLGANSTLTITSATQSFGASSLLTLNTSAGGANGATVGNAIMVWNTGTAGSIINNAFLVTDAGGTGFATKNGSNQIIRLNTTLLPASGAVSATNYFIDNNTGGTAAAGSNTLTLSASEAANSISVDTTANSGTLDLGAGSFTL